MANRIAEGRNPAAFLALGAVAGITLGWWALALWPLPADAPAWVARTRAICFGTGGTGLPDAAGWIALFVQPAVMLAVVGAVWGRELATGLRRISNSRTGRLAGVGAVLCVVVAAGLATHRVYGALATAKPTLPQPMAEHTRLDRTAPTIELVDQAGEVLTLERFLGRPVIVVAAFAHCETACPLLVSNALVAQRTLNEIEPVVLVLTLDPWRDTLQRLPAIARSWKLPTDAFVLSGDVEMVNGTLDEWSFVRSRNPRDGSIVHQPRAYLVDREGRIAFEMNGNSGEIVELAREL